MNCEAYPSEAALASTLARRIADIVKRRRDLVLGLPTGRTPLPLYAELIALTRSEQIDWSAIRTFNLDEFIELGAGDPGSYHTFMHERLFSGLNVRATNVGFLDGRASDPEGECDRFERAIAAAGGIDLLILGIGVNGHIGFNEPGDALIARTHLITLDEPTRAANALWFGGDLRRVPRQALTMGMATILNARSIVLIATGEAKNDAVAGMLQGDVTTHLPASFLQLHPQVTVMLDDSVADGLSSCGPVSRR